MFDTFEPEEMNMQHHACFDNKIIYTKNGRHGYMHKFVISRRYKIPKRNINCKQLLFIFISGKSFDLK